MSVYDFSVKNVEGGTTSLSEYKGKREFDTYS